MAKNATPSLPSEFPQRINQQEKEFIVDTYKLKPAPVWKRVGKSEDFWGNQSDWVQMEHTHIFRSMDEHGKKHIRSIPIGGHYHLVEVQESSNPNEAPKIISVSGPMVMSTEKNKKTGKMEKVDVPLNDFDDHTHDWEFIGHHKFGKRVMNVEAAKAHALITAKGAPVPGVKESL